MQGNSINEILENIKYKSSKGTDFWLARELQNVLGYVKWDNFKNAIDKAKIACTNSDQQIINHFADIEKMVDIGSSTKRPIEDIALTRYACYLLLQNCDSTKQVVAHAQSYFAIKTRQQEIQELISNENEDKKRLAIRKELAEHNKSLAEAANMAGIFEPIDYAIFRNEGYKDLYGGLTIKEIHKKKALKKNEQILDHMGSTELAANLFRATQTDEKIRRENIRGKENANQAHYEVGKKVRQTIKELGGTMPENLPPSERSIKQIEKSQYLLTNTKETQKGE